MTYWDGWSSQSQENWICAPCLSKQQPVRKSTHRIRLRYSENHAEFSPLSRTATEVLVLWCWQLALPFSRAQISACLVSVPSTLPARRRSSSVGAHSCAGASISPSHAPSQWTRWHREEPSVLSLWEFKQQVITFHRTVSYKPSYCTDP